MPAQPETPPEYCHSKSIIVIHPGSLNLRIGRASDLNPATILHVIARRCYPNGHRYKDTFLPPRSEMCQTQELEDTRLSVSHTLQSCLQSDGRRRYATPPQQIAAFNRRSQPEILGANGGEWMKPEGDIIVGNDVLRISPNEDFNIHFPFKRGDLNVHSGPGGSLTSILADLETIWMHVLETHFAITKKDLKLYKAVLIIPDIYNRTYLKELTTLLLSKMEFGSCFLVQDHVAATFGSGLSYACVVDVGDQKTSVSCVEDGICHSHTRVRMAYGGADITQTFFWLLQKCAFPYKNCNDNNKLDTMLLRKLKEDFCHVNLDICGSQEKTFIVRQPNLPILQYTIQVGDECIVAPLSLFSPELFGITGAKSFHTQKRSTGDSEDPHDENYLREIRRKGMKESMETSSADLLNEAYYEQTNIQNNANEDDIVVDTIDAVVPNKEFVINPGQILGLDQAVLQSIDRCTNEDLKRKMYGCILIVGGGMKFAGIATWLQNRISLQIPYVYRAEQLDIIINPRDMDSAMVAWKGASIMSCLETAQELWVQAKEWEKYGVRMLRERAPFTWKIKKRRRKRRRTHVTVLKKSAYRRNKCKRIAEEFQKPVSAEESRKPEDLDIFNHCYKNISKEKKFNFKKLIGKETNVSLEKSKTPLSTNNAATTKHGENEAKESPSNSNKKDIIKKDVPPPKTQIDLIKIKKSVKYFDSNSTCPSKLQLLKVKDSKADSLDVKNDIGKKASVIPSRKLDTKFKFKSNKSSKLALISSPLKEKSEQKDRLRLNPGMSSEITQRIALLNNKEKSSPSTNKEKTSPVINKEPSSIKKTKKFTFKKVIWSGEDALKNLLDDNGEEYPNVIFVKEKTIEDPPKTDLVVPSCSKENNETICDKSDEIDDLMVSFTNTQSMEEDEILARMLDEEEHRNYELFQSQKSSSDDQDRFLLENVDWSDWSDDENKKSKVSNQEAMFENGTSKFEAIDGNFPSNVEPVINRTDNTAEFKGVFPHTEVLKEMLHAKFGLVAYRPNQEEIINASLEQHDCFVLMPTGGGKSLCYQLPALLTPGVTIVISPLRALISDQVDKLNSLDIPAAHLCGQLNQTQSNAVLLKMHVKEPTIKLLYLTPEKIVASMQVSDLLLSLYKREKLARFVIDEAHCLSHWGHDFRPDYKQLSSLRRLYPNVPIMCLTATATDLVQKDVTTILKLKNVKTFIRSFNRPNIKYKVIEKIGKNVVRDIADLIKENFLKKSGIIYCLARNDCENVAKDLRQYGIKAMAYHAGMGDNQRENLQRDWMNDKFHVIVATIAFGMGIDKPDVRYVIHNSVPKSVEAFYQESGRGGRDGELSYSYLFYSYADAVRLQKLIKLDRTVSEKCLEGHFENIQQMVSYCENKVDCRRYLQLMHLGEKFNRILCVENKLSMCDNCENINSTAVIDITKECKELAKLVNDLTNRDKVTMVQIGDVYKGSMLKKIVEKQYDKHPYFGNGKHFSKVDIHRFLKQMLYEKVIANYCFHAGEFPIVYIKKGLNYSELFNTDKKISISVNTNTPPTPKPSTSKTKTTEDKEEPKPSTSKLPEHEVNNLKVQCHEELLEVCRNFAVERNTTLSSIMNLAAISKMAKSLPNTKEEFMKVQHVTNANYEKFGDAFLAVTQKYRLLLDKMESIKEKPKMNTNSDDEWKTVSSQGSRKGGTKRKRYKRRYKGKSKKMKK